MILSFLQAGSQTSVSVATVVGPVLTAVIVGAAGIWGYGWQKKADRNYDLLKLRQAEYERYLLAFQRASQFKGVDEEKHTQAEAAYHEIQNFMLLHASEEVIKAVNATHTYYVESEKLDWREYKSLYAKMIIVMRKDGYSPTSLSVQELAENIPWTIGSEPEDRKAAKKIQ